MALPSISGETALSYDESLVGLISVLSAVTAAAIAVGPWSVPYELKTIAAIKQRFGKPAARGVWVALAIGFLTAGFAILNGIRPPYAVPASQVDVNR
tara:strand:- start:321437 stop:321727 length:291 start_codon:yes stop_codon:yes gene_type:complete